MMDRGHGIAAGLLAGLLLLAATAEAQVGFRAAASSGTPASTAITFRAAAQAGAASGVLTLTINKPTGTVQNDVMIASIAVRPNTATITPPGGWTLVRRMDNANATANSLAVYRKVAGASEPTNYSWTFSTSTGSAGGIQAFAGVDTATPINVENGQNTASSLSHATPSVTTTVANTMLVTSHGISNADTWTPPTGMTEAFDVLGGLEAIEGSHVLQAAAGPTGTKQATSTPGPADVGNAHILALSPGGTSLTINKPTGTAQNDVMIASVAVRPNTVTITAPSGWTLVRRVDNATATANSLAVYRKAAGASEPASYTWTVSTHTGATGGIQTFAGVDTTTPIDVENGQNTPNGTAHGTPTVTTTVANTMLVTSHGVSNPGPNHWTPPTGMTEAFDDFGGIEAIEGNYVLQATAGATGAKSATSAVADSGNAHILALRPSCSAVADAAYVAAAAASGAGSVTVYWSSASSPLILRKTTAFGSEAPTGGQAYTAGNSIGTATVAYDGSAGIAGMTCSGSSCTNTGLSNQTYYYKVFPRVGNCYAVGIGAEVNATVQAGTHPAWSYMLAGGSMLKAGIAGNGAIYTGSNASRIVSLSTTDGTQSWAPVATTDAVQGWLTWIPISGGSNAAVIGGDWAGTVYSVNTATGATNWAVTLPGGTNEPVQAPAAAQLRVFSDATFQATHATDIVLVATRTASTTNNKLYALRASDGGIAWTFNGTGSQSVDYIVGQPYVDYGRNRVYLATRAGAGAQSSLWVIDTLNGSLVASFPLGHLESSPTLSYSGGTLWVANTAGDLYAINTATLAQKWTSPAALGSAVKGFVWEDLTTAGRLYFTTADGNVWCIQDPGAGSPPNPASPVWKTMVPGASMPLLLDSIYVGSTDGSVHELNVITGADTKQFTLAGTVGDLSTEDSTQLFAPTSAGTIHKLPLPLP